MKVGFKSRHNRWRSKPMPHRGHRKKLPDTYDREARRHRRKMLIMMRARDLEDY